jgi:N6-adenosine-specific RNA methylase IME4
MKFGVIVADPPWRFADKLTMSDVKRGADSHYATMSIEQLAALGTRVQAVANEPCVLALWVPKSMLADGLAVMTAWGFKQKTVYTWTKRTANGAPAFGMGRLFRATGEIALIGTRGTGLSSLVQNKSQRDHIDHPTLRHSAKPEGLQDSLHLMFPHTARLEMFARRARPGWKCVGLECPDTQGEDIATSLERLAQARI